MAGKMSTGIVPAESAPSKSTTRQNAATVNGRRSASRTIHMLGGPLEVAARTGCEIGARSVAR